MKIYNSSGTQILDVQVDDNSFRHRVIMGDNNLTLHYSLAVHVEIPVGSYCVFEGQTFTLKRPENLKMKHTRNFEYTVLLESPQADAKIWKFRNTVDGRLKFPLTARASEHLAMFVANMNRRGSGWSVGSCIDSVEHLINYDHDYCWDALAKMADEFGTEFEIVGKQVSLKRVEYNKSNPLALSYGKGNGFRSGIARNSSDTMPVEILFVQGGTQNIDSSKYHSSVLLLPKNQSISYDGEHFEGEAGYSSSNARSYVVDNLGLSIRRSDKSPSTYAEDSLDCSSVYPRRVGKVSSVVTEDAEHNFYDIVDNSIPSSLNYADCQIEGEKLTVIFQSGMLAGHGEFDVNYFHNAVNGKAARRFEIVPKDEDGYTMPNETFKPAVNDEYVIFNCMLPDAYICDNNTKTGAEWDMFKEAVRYMFNHEEEIFSFKGELDSIWAKQDWVNIGGKIVLGGYISFTDSRFQPSGILVRIVSIKDYVNNPHKPEIELSNQTQSVGMGTDIKKLESYEVETEEYHRDALSFTKRRFRDAKETMDMLQALIDAGFDNFTNGITPITVQTMQLLVGDESLQYRFVNNTTTPSTVAHNVTYNASTKVLSAPEGTIQHLTLGIKNLSSSHAATEYKYWSVSAYNSAALTDGTKKYYLYIKASKSASTATFTLSETPIAMEAVSGYYHFLYGILNSEYEDGRSFVPLYGFTEVLPGRVTTDKVVSGDGNSYFDMLNNAMKLGDKLKFNVNGDGKLVLKGTLVQSSGGDDEQPVGCFRGVWNENYVYYVGDEVVYTANGITSYYRCIQQTTAGIVPTNTLYWQVLSAGVRGHFKSRAFKRTNTDISATTPTGGTYDSPVPTGWSDGIPDGTAMLWSTVCTFYSDGTSSGWSHPARETDTDTLDIEFSASSTEPSAPTGNTPFADHSEEGWYDPSNLPEGETMIWRAERKVSNGVYEGDWVITRIYGEKGNKGQSSYKSTVFCRSNTTPQAPASNQGSFAQPAPATATSWQAKDTDGNNISGVYWHDGIPAGEAILWASTRIFSDDGLSPQQASWRTPRQMTDTDTYDVEFAPMQANDATPSEPSDSNRHKSAYPYGYSGQVWFDPSLDKYSASGVLRNFTNMYWRAEREKKNGVWGDWTIVRIKGETGNDAISKFKSTAYIRLPLAAGSPSAPTGGTWDSPVPTSTIYVSSIHASFSWSDGIPEGSYALWETTRVFYSDNRTTYWTTPRKVTDTATYDVEFAKKQSGDATPATPTDANRHGGSGTQIWFDPKLDPLEDFTAMYWKAERECLNGEWGDWVITRIKGEQGQRGYTGDYYEYRYAVNGSTTSAPSLSTSSRNPSGWSTSIPAVGTLEYLWMTVAKISGIDDTLLTNWSTPVRHTAVDAVALGENLIDNSEEAEVYEVIESGAYNTSTPPSQFIETSKRFCRIPAEGTVLSGQVRITLTGCSFKSGGGSVLVYINGSAVWPPVGQKTGITSNGTYILKNEALTLDYNGGVIYKPINVRLNNFNAGGVITIERVKVETGYRCSEWSLSEADKHGPAVLFQGVYDSTSVYYGNRNRIDCVKYNGLYYAARADAGQFSGITPTDDDYWNPFGGQFESVATQLLLAEFAYIENLGVRHLLTAESGKRVHISADENAMTIYDSDDQASVVFSGDVFADSELFGGSEQTLSPQNFSSSYYTGSQLHPNIAFVDNSNRLSFTTTKAGVVSGSVTIQLSSTGSYTQSSGMSRVAGADLYLMLDNAYLDSVSLPELGNAHGTNSVTKTFNFSKNVTIGSHTLKVRVEISNPNYSSGSYSVSASASFGTTKMKYDIRMSRYFANGNAVGSSSEQYVESLMDSNNKVLHKVRSGNAGFEVNDGTFKIRIGGTLYTATTTTINGERVLKLTQ